ncbi:Rrf2 family transcriptional regulator [Geobacter sp. AOG1]|uniref:Rrf2 family transcriptional regulator n=1 Tax=Geobacter sp. AOG1 TaxID=1566346 RepID=UPI001CC61B4E|nr:Rrf2 family transcriptional regulator [Geobacter sp. AOG1]GFE57909.1 transcriptional regulator [Geobacter sp. AOG1]
MRLSTRAQYAVRAMVDLSLYSEGRPVSLKEISRREEIPLNYLEQLFFRLKKGQIVTSVRGPGGGYVLARQEDAIKVGEIVVTVEEQLNPVACLDEGDRSCRREAHCVTHFVWQGLGERIRGFLDSITLADLTREARNRPAGEGNIEKGACKPTG